MAWLTPSIALSADYVIGVEFDGQQRAVLPVAVERKTAVDLLQSWEEKELLPGQIPSSSEQRLNDQLDKMCAAFPCAQCAPAPAGDAARVLLLDLPSKHDLPTERR